MIWVEGKILPDDGLNISVLDRTFEHGLGLFETLRTWGGRPTLLEKHKARMLRSASELKLPIDPASLPDAEDVRTLLEAEGAEGDRMIRITASGGTAAGPSVVWMRSSPLPGPMGEGGASLLLNAWKVSPDDPMVRHKTLNYWPRRLAFEEARHRGFDEALSGLSEEFEDWLGGSYYEGSYTNLFAIQYRGLGLFKTRRPVIVTASTSRPLVPGIMRWLVLEVARELPIELEVVDDLKGIEIGNAVEVFLTNAVRGIIPVARAVILVNGVEKSDSFSPGPWTVPGPWTMRLQELIARRLWPDRGGETP